MSTLPSNLSLIHAYRHLYRQLLHCVQFSKPSRYVARDQLRKAFRKEDPSSFNQARIDKTLIFLKAATAERGIEHRIVKNLLRVEGERVDKLKWQWTPRRDLQHVRKTAYVHYQMTVAMLNDSMGLCLR